jgi:hypothetical protein
MTGMPHVRVFGFAAATARDGQIDLIGGCLLTEVSPTGFNSSCLPPNPVDTYDPRTNSWKTIGSTLNARQELAATTGPDGQVYAAGGIGEPGSDTLLEVIRSPAAAFSTQHPSDGDRVGR